MDNTQSPDIVVLNFADSKIPVFKETRQKDYILYGEKNIYPEYLTYLFNKSAKHNAILTGKANYIFGEGFENGDVVINRLGDTINDIAKKVILDVEIYGGFRLEIIWNQGRQISEIYHVDYTTIRVGKDGGFYYKESWEKSYPQIEEEFIPAFNPGNPVGNQIYSYTEYRPMTRFYPLPSYIGCNNYIETDIEISKYYLSSIRNGMMPSKLVQFYQGEPKEEQKRELEQRFKSKFAGAENAGKFILVFNNSKDKTVDITDLSASEIDKMFVELNKTCQQEIFSGHLVTSPMLFGIKTEGQLGGNTELYTAYSIFQNTYAKPKASAVSKEFTYLFGFSKYAVAYDLLPTDPIGIQFDIKDVINALPKAFVFRKLGIPEDMWNLENIGADNRPTPTIPIQPNTQNAPVPGTAPTEPGAMANDNIKNLTAKQHQQLLRIIRQHSKGQLNDTQAKTMLRTGLGLSDEDINSMLGIEPVALAAMDTAKIDEVLAMFDSCGDSKKDFEVLKTKKVSFSSEAEAAADEDVYIREAFNEYDVTTSENQILELIRKDKRITPEVIAGVIGESPAFVQSKIDGLVKKGYLEQSTETIGEDAIIERIVPKSVDVLAPPPIKGTLNPAQVFIKYSYEGPQDKRNRPFCSKMMQLNRLYSRAEIESISQRLGYSVFDRRGGFWNNHGTILPHCRHNWKSNIVVKK